VSFIVGQLLN